MGKLRSVTSSWRKEAADPPELAALASAAIKNAIAHNHEEAAKRLTAEAERLRSRTGRAGADRAAALERAAGKRQQDAERLRAIADQIVKRSADLPEIEALGTLDAKGVERFREEVIAALAHEAQRLAAEAESVRSATLDELTTTVHATLREEAERLRAENEAALAEQARDTQAQLAGYAAALERADAARAREAERLNSEAEQALARADALAEQVANLLSSLGARDVRAVAKRSTLPSAEMHPEARGQLLDANEVTLDDLRGLTLSLTQATRMLNHREALGGFTSLEQLDDVPGISRELRAGLKRALTIPGQPGSLV